MKITGVVHVHSSYSYDGKESLLSLRDFLVSKGISFCCLTEHTDFLTVEQAQLFVQECKALTTSSFVFIPGFEVPYKNAHILQIGTEVFLGQKADEIMLREWSKKSALTVLAHPVRNAFTLDTAMEEVIDGVEIWNQQYEGKLVPLTRSVSLFKKLQNKNQQLLATCGLDFHRREHFGSPIYTLELSSLSKDSILTALQNGEYVFGRGGVSVSSSGLWRNDNSVAYLLQSFCSVGIIILGKSVNSLLALFGLKLPKWIKYFVRSRV